MARAWPLACRRGDKITQRSEDIVRNSLATGATPLEVGKGRAMAALGTGLTPKEVDIAPALAQDGDRTPGWM